MKIVAILKKLGTTSILGLSLATGAAHAVPFYWTDWIDSQSGPFQAEGVITTSSSSVGVTYTNALGVGFYQPAGGIDYWTGGSGATSPYTSSLVDNRPTGSDIIALSYAGPQTLTFSEFVTNPVFAFASLNGNGYAFDQDFEILSLGGVDGNACGYWGCGGATKLVVDLGGGNFEYQLNSNNIGGLEPHGAIRFVDSFDTLSWRSSSNEFWNGFTVGIQGTAVEVCTGNSTLPECGAVSVPEPGTTVLFGVGIAFIYMNRRKKLGLALQQVISNT